MKNSTQSPQRLEYIDLAKGIGIIFYGIKQKETNNRVYSHPYPLTTNT